jgi:hypothetical protein
MAGSGENHWHSYYEANREQIRTSLWGQIRELEGKVPKTAYAQIPRARLSEFAPELIESLGLLQKGFVQIVDEIRSLVFDKGDEFNGAIRDSLLAEAHALHGLLAKVGVLVEVRGDPGDLERIAVAHDQWCGRAKTMEVVAAYLRSKKGEARS